VHGGGYLFGGNTARGRPVKRAYVRWSSIAYLDFLDERKGQTVEISRKAQEELQRQLHDLQAIADGVAERIRRLIVNSVRIMDEDGRRADYYQQLYRTDWNKLRSNLLSVLEISSKILTKKIRKK